ncbi:MAG: hypothetical protein H6581_29955 [Bacteroidia bacterium]|nr:hypothetical protein [Bacteroidia bacterium]
MAHPEFAEFLNFFPEIEFPYTQNDQTVEEISQVSQRVPVEMTRKFITDAPGSLLIGEGGPNYPESEDLYILDAFIPVGKYQRGEFWGLLYCLVYQGCAELGLASYTKGGELVSRIHFAGSDSDLHGLEGTLYDRGGEVKLKQTDFQEGDKGHYERALAVHERHISMGEQGVMLDNATGEVIRDEF